MSIRLPKRKKLPDVAVEGVSAASAGPEELLSIAQAATFAGVAQITVRRWVKQRALPAYRAGAQIRISKADLIRFIRSY